MNPSLYRLPGMVEGHWSSGWRRSSSSERLVVSRHNKNPLSIQPSEVITNSETSGK
ncbi:hypothetical protein [Neorhodopirellula lusitana]|uniref:hypothetical protein n=1 Tax=Neorhodopirellula lusitana TaxID=445327 RepID=UPI0024B6DB87|nr:hypothetical protein [Neorhodopirellula lusitana]